MLIILLTIALHIKCLFAYSAMSIRYDVRHGKVFSDAAGVTNLQQEQGVTFKHCVLLCSRLDECCTVSYIDEGGMCQLNSDCCPPTIATNHGKAVIRDPSLVPSTIRTDCSDIMPGACSGVYTIVLPDNSLKSIRCEMETDGGQWTVIQRRFDGSIPFYRGWEEYKVGFGDINGEFWIGNEIIHGILSGNSKMYKLRFDLVAFNDETAYAEYSEFYADSEATDYTITLNNYSGNAGDAMSDIYGNSVSGLRFSTLDRDNDISEFHCARDTKQAGFWFSDCSRANVNGIYISNGDGEHVMYWKTWRASECLKESRMMIKPVA